MSWLHLLWIVPLSAAIGYVVCGLLSIRNFSKFDFGDIGDFDPCEVEGVE